MATTRFVLGILCLIGTFSFGVPNGNLLEKQSDQSRLIATAVSQLGVVEKGGNNHGKQVEVYLAYTFLDAGNPWCAAFVSWVFGQTGIAKPRTAWSPALFETSKLVSAPKPSVIYGIYSDKHHRIVHCGLTETVKDEWVIGIEGNTNLSGSADGEGVYRKWRHIKTLKYFANWLPKKGGLNE